MPANISLKDAASAVQVVKTTQDGNGVHTPSQNAQLQVGGADVSAGNPIPTSTALGSYALAVNVALTSTTYTAAVTPITGGTYIWSLAGALGSNTVVLQCLGPDGATWLDICSLAAAGIYAGDIMIGTNGAVRLRATGNVTGVYSTLAGVR